MISVTHCAVTAVCLCSSSSSKSLLYVTFRHNDLLSDIVNDKNVVVNRWDERCTDYDVSRTRGSTPRHAQTTGDLGFAAQFNAETQWHFAQLRYPRVE